MDHVRYETRLTAPGHPPPQRKSSASLMPCFPASSQNPTAVFLVLDQHDFVPPQWAASPPSISFFDSSASQFDTFEQCTEPARTLAARTVLLRILLKGFQHFKNHIRSAVGWG
mmetsp:Transcript_41078/g.64150  ORF Transcript_41078/g.64150 Transcript_41078/m.64150 type:complete len:113 (+) Transcript_41078:1263-1601(+)